VALSNAHFHLRVLKKVVVGGENARSDELKRSASPLNFPHQFTAIFTSLEVKMPITKGIPKAF